MKNAFVLLLRDESGATLVEYGIIAAALAVPFIAGASAIVSTISSALSGTTAGMQSIGANPP